MEKKVVKINEAKIKEMVYESVKRILKEGIDEYSPEGYLHAADVAMSKGRTGQAEKFTDAANDRVQKEYPGVTVTTRSITYDNVQGSKVTISCNGRMALQRGSGDNALYRPEQWMGRLDDIYMYPKDDKTARVVAKWCANNLGGFEAPKISDWHYWSPTRNVASARLAAVSPSMSESIDRAVKSTINEMLRKKK